MSRFRKIQCFSAALALMLSSHANAQVLYGSIVGTVYDSSSAAIPEATVRVTQTETNQTREVQTNESGGYTLSTVPAGTYVVTITKDGFRQFTTQNVRVNLNTVVRVDATLSVGAAAETVEVTAAASALKTDRADVSTEFSNNTVITLPLANRTYQSVMALVPGVTPPVSDAGGVNNPGRSMQMTANGSSRSGVNVRIDGVSTTNVWVQFFQTYIPSMEAIDTVNVVTNSFDAEQGMVGGAAINLQIKSGSNDLHGSAYWYHQDNVLKAKPWIMPANERKPKFIRNVAGGTFGGRIIKDKLFYFGSYEGDYLRQANSVLGTVPTAAIRAGNMSGSDRPIFDPATGAPNGSGRTPFPNNTIPANRLDPITQKLVALVPAPNLPGLANNYFVNTPITYNLHKIDTKVDYKHSNNVNIFWRLGLMPFDRQFDTMFGEVLGGSPDHIVDGKTLSTSGSVNWVVSPTIVVDATIGYNRQHSILLPPGTDTKYGSDVLGIPGTNLGTGTYAGGMPRFNVTSYSFYGYNYTPLDYLQPQFQYTANASLVKRSHNIRFGVDVWQRKMDHIEFAPTAFNFTGSVTSMLGGASPNQYNSYADFLLGAASNWNNAYQSVPFVKYRSSDLSLYVRDQWQVSRKLTFTLGVRWEYYPVPNRGDRGIERYDFDTKTYLICGTGSTPRDCGIKVQKGLFSPRAGLAYRATEGFVIRAGYALNYQQQEMYRDGMYSWPMTISYTANATNFFPVGSLAQGIPVNQPPDISGGSTPLPPGVGFTTLPEDYKRGYIQTYNFTLQKELAKNWVAEAGYVGSHTVKQQMRWNINYGQVGGGVASQPFFSQGITAGITYLQPLQNMNYNSLQTSLERRFSSGVQLKATYTFSKWIGMCCDDSADGGPAISIPSYFQLNRSLMPGDRPHNFRASGFAELPFGRGKRWANQPGFASAVAGGWQLNGIFSAYSGLPFSVTAAGTSLNAPGSTQRADVVKTEVAKLGGIGAGNPFFDPLAFKPVTDVRFGTAGFNTLRGPGAVNVDLSVFRTFRLNEKFNLQFRAEALNATNTPHFSNPGNNVSNMQLNPDGTVRSLNGYAEVTSVNANGNGREGVDERFFRLGLRLSF